MAVAIGLFASGWPEYVRAHPYWVGAAFLIGAALVAIGFWPSTSPVTKEPSVDQTALAETRIQKARDNSGKMFQADKIEIYEAPRELPATIPPAPQSPRLPTLELSFAISHGGVDDDYFKFKEGGFQIIVVRVRNRPAVRGETAPHARDIFAQLDFDSSIGRSTVERAYWVGIDNSQISLAGGDEAWVLVGVPESGFLSSWHNRNTYSRRIREWSSPNHEPENRTIPWGQGELTGQIYIVSHSLRGNVTLEHKRFVLTREEWFGDFGKINMRFID
jgi:hypothetical protein